MISDLDNSQVAVVNPLMREKRVRSLLGVPLIVEGEVIGVLHVGSLTQRDFTDADVELLQLVADRVALVDRALSPRRPGPDRSDASAQPASAQPAAAPRTGHGRALPPAAEESAVGGDWYDVIELGHRRLGLAIGDVAGHGMAAATYMGELRSAMRAYALEVESPGVLLGKLARFADQEDSRMATVIYAVLNLDTWVVEFARAGHPYPLLVRPDGSAIFLMDAGGPPLGTGRPRGLRRDALLARLGRDPASLHRRPDRAARPAALRRRGGADRGRDATRRTSRSSDAGRSSAG